MNPCDTGICGGLDCPDCLPQEISAAEKAAIARGSEQYVEKNFFAIYMAKRNPYKAD